LGGALATFVTPGSGAGSRPWLLVLEAGFLVAFALVALPAAANGDGRATGLELGVLVALGAAAMGVQTSAVLRVWRQSVSTTFTSAMLHDAGRLGADLARSRSEDSSRPSRGLVVLVTAVVVYAGGAALGTLAAKGGPVWLFVPAVVISAAGAMELLRRS
jgi:uncharacterized membrane protein YoaK (UPF0700 family)